MLGDLVPAADRAAILHRIALAPDAVLEQPEALGPMVVAPNVPLPAVSLKLLLDRIPPVRLMFPAVTETPLALVPGHVLSLAKIA